MTENLLQKLEEKMMVILTEIETSREKIKRLERDNLLLKSEMDNHTNKLADLISLLDAINTSDNMIANVAVSGMKPVLVQG